MSLALAAASVLALAPGNACAQTAVVTDGHIHRIDPQTDALMPAPVKTLKRRVLHAYRAGEDGGTFRFQDVRYELEPGTMVVLGCYGESKAAGARWPRVAVFEGGLRVTSEQGAPGAVSNGAGMAHAMSRAAMTFTATADGYHGLRVQKSRSAPGKLQVTPYAGPRKGTCRYVTGSASLDAEEDRALYDGRRD